MAEKRFIGRRITESDKIRSLANDGKLLATTLYAFLLPYLDKQGRMNANALLLKGGLFEGYVWTIEDIDEAVRDLARVGLVRLYSNGRFSSLIQYEKFLAEHGGFNTPHPKEPESDLPGPDDAGSEPVITPERDPDSAQEPSSTQPEHDREEAGKKPGNVQADIEVKVKGEVKVEELSANADAQPTFEDLTEIWNAESGNLRKVTDLKAAQRNPELQRLTTSFLKRHGPRALDLFRAGIPAVRADPHWLGKKADRVTRAGAAYGITNYLRHVEDKAEEAADLHTTSTTPKPTAPTRPWEEWDIAQHHATGEVATITELLADGTARMNNGETWNLTECARCNN